METNTNNQIRVAIALKKTRGLGDGRIKSNSPLLLERNKLAVYEVSALVPTLGAAFLTAACSETRRQRDVAGVTLKTWRDNYARVLVEFLTALSAYTAILKRRCADDLTNTEWTAFGVSYSKTICAGPLSPKTVSTRIACTNKLLTILARASVIPIVVELPRPIPRTIARNGESRFTQKGWQRVAEAPMPISPYNLWIPEHRRDYDYQPFRRLGREFMLVVVSELRRYYGRFSAGRAKAIHNAVVSLLSYLVEARNAGHFPNLFASISSADFSSTSALAWEHALYAWRDSMERATRTFSSTKRIQTQHSIIKAANAVWRHLALVGVVPKVEILGFKNAKRSRASQPRPTLAQLSSNDASRRHAENTLADRIEPFLDSNDRSQAREFIRSLSQELPPSVTSSLSLASLIEQIHALNSRRLRALRACAEADFLKWHAHWLHGQAALNEASLAPAALTELLDSKLLSVSERRRNSQALLSDGPESLRLANALNYVIGTQGGFATGVNGRYHHLGRMFGGKFSFHAYMHPHQEAMTALWVMLMIDTGANCEVVREMPFECLNPTNSPETRKITFAAKGRAGGLVVVDELNIEPRAGEKLSAVSAIEIYIKMSARYRAAAEPDVARRLLLIQLRDQVTNPTEFTARAHFIELMKRHKELSVLDARPSYIRPSILLEVHGLRGDGAAAAQAVADHLSPATTQNHYTGRTPTVLFYSHKIREFQDRFQAVIVASIDDAAAKLGLTEDQFEQILSDAARTGLGVACLNPVAGIQPGTERGDHCTRLDACPSCEMRWVVGTVDNIADMILFNEYLRSSQESLYSSHPDIWEQRWLPWLVFSDIALQKLSQGETASAFLAAKRAANDRRNTYAPFPLQ